MATKNIAEVVIAGRILKITGYESAEYLHQIASYINDKIAAFQDMEGYRRQPADQKQIMIYMNLADDYFKSRRQAEKQKAELEKKEKEMYSLKHDLIESQLARENLEKSTREKIEQLEASSKEEIKRLKEASRELEKQKNAVQEELERQKAAAREELEKQKSAAQAELERQKSAFQAELEQAAASKGEGAELAAAREETEQLQKQIRELRQQIFRLESEGKGKANRNAGYHNN